MRLMVSALYVLQLIVAYQVMLIVMTYNIGICAAVFAGMQSSVSARSQP
jgi:hypothetical protein